MLGSNTFLLKTARCFLFFGSLSWLLSVNYCTPIYAANNSASCSSGTSPVESTALESIYNKVEALVQRFYPRAKLSVAGKAVHFEYKVKTENGTYSGRPEFVPSAGGILGDLSLQEGRYEQSDKNQLPAEVTDGFHTNLIMAPYSNHEKCHLLAKLVLPSDVPTEFRDSFKEIVNSFNASEPPNSAAAGDSSQSPHSAPSSGVGGSAKSAASSNEAPDQHPGSTGGSALASALTVSPGPLQTERQKIAELVYSAETGHLYH